MVLNKTVLGIFTKEFQLVLLFAKFPFGIKEKEEISLFLQNNSIDWNEFYELLIAHKISMIVFHRLEKLPEIIGIIPSNVFEKLKKYCKNKLLTNLLNTKELLLLYKKAEKEGVEMIPYKGPVFTHEVYGNIGFRSFGDIDFWYPVEQTAALKKMITEEGYKLRTVYTPIQIYFFRKINCEYHYVKYYNQQRVLIEPHFWLMNHFLQKNPSSTDIKNATYEINILNQKIKTFPPELMLVYIGLHHGANENWCILKYHVDLAAFVNRYFDELDWDKVLEKCREYEVEKIILVGLKNIQELFATPLPGVLKDALNDKNIQQISSKYMTGNSLLLKKETNTFFKIKFLWKTRASWRQKIKLAYRIVEYSFLRLIFEALMKIT